MRPLFSKIVGTCYYAVLGALALVTLAGCSVAPPTVQEVQQVPAVVLPSDQQVSTTTPAPKRAALPSFNSIYVIVMENKEYGSVVGNPQLPYINSLIAQYGLATNYDAVTHPSQPNYLALLSGSTQGVTDDGVHEVNGPNLLDQIEAKGRTWRVYEQNLPGGCFTGATASGGYARRHDPAMSFTQISGSPSRCANITDLTNFDPNAANFEFIVPNTCNDMHNCGAPEGDRFLKSFVPGILASRAWKQGGVLFIVWDEGTSNLGGGGRVPLLVISNQVAAGFKSALPHNHYSLVRTIEDAWGLGCLNHACTANNLAEFFVNQR